VLLSVVSAIFIIALEGLMAIGLAISWWRSISHGTTLKRLHFIWNGMNIFNIIPAFMAGMDTRKVAFAAIAIALAKFLNGPLLQRSTRAKNFNVRSDVPMRMLIAPKIPNGWYGTQGVSTTPGLVTLQNWYLNNTISTSTDPGYYCKGNGTCEASVAGAGINYGCDSTSTKIDLLDTNNHGAELFNISTFMNYDFGQNMLFLTAKYLDSADDNCMGEVITQTCNIIAATVEYPITIKNTTITLNLGQLLSNLTVLANYTSPGDDPNLPRSAFKGPLKGLQAVMGNYMSSAAWLDTSRVYWRSSPLPNLFYDADESHPNCSLRFKNPADYVLTSFFEFLMRSAIDISQNASAHGVDLEPYTTNLTAQFTGTELHYHSDFRYLAGAIVIMLLGCTAVVFLLWGWWELGRPVTLSPLETAKAFGAPILLGAGPEKEANDIVEEIGNERVAHDGDELLWNGTVYASGRWEMGQVPTARGRSTSGGSFMGTDSPKGSPRSHNREGSFEHGSGVKVRSYGEGNLSSAGGRRGSGQRALRPLSAIDESPTGL